MSASRHKKGVITFSANDIARVSTLPTTQAIIFLELRGICRPAGPDPVTRLRIATDQPKLEKHLEELICETCLPVMSENSQSIFEPIFFPSSMACSEVWPQSLFRERPASYSPYFGKGQPNRCPRAISRSSVWRRSWATTNWILGIAVFFAIAKIGVFGLGYGDLEAMLHGGVNGQQAGILLVGKLAATTAVYAWGAPGVSSLQPSSLVQRSVSLSPTFVNSVSIWSQMIGLLSRWLE